MSIRSVLAAFAVFVFTCSSVLAFPPDFDPSHPLAEQSHEFTLDSGVRVRIDVPAGLDGDEPVELVVYALPNGNTIEQTAGKQRGPGVGWRFDIQHIAAQTRALRAITGRNLAVAYLEAEGLSWPAWRGARDNSGQIVVDLVNRLRADLPGPVTSTTLSSHSGGGAFVLEYIQAAEAIPGFIKRIVFLDSNYSYLDEIHGEKLLNWLRGDGHVLVVMAYDDRDVTFDGKKIVSDTGGTWRATERMMETLGREYELETKQEGGFVHYWVDGKIDIWMHLNPDRKILHTALIGEMNGYMRALTVYTKDGDAVASPGPPRLYEEYISGDPASVDSAEIPPRPEGAMTGTEFIESVEDLPRQAREAAVERELLKGNIPNFLRKTIPVTVTAQGLEGTTHTLVFETMPDYLAIGSDEDFVRMPMNPHTAQAFCDAFDFVMPTRKMVDAIWEAAELKLEPKPLTEEREAAATFLQHHNIIEEQRGDTPLGILIAGIKKDVVISNRLQERPNRVAIYGWHYKTGKPIQPLTIVHVDWYVDYSHGIRPVRRMMRIDNGKTLPYEEILSDPHLYNLLSDEGEIAISYY